MNFSSKEKKLLVDMVQSRAEQLRANANRFCTQPDYDLELDRERWRAEALRLDALAERMLAAWTIEETVVSKKRVFQP